MTNRHEPVLMPSEVSSRVGLFDRFAGVVVEDREPRRVLHVLRAARCGVGADVLLDPATSTRGSSSSTPITTIITFLMVALLQNSQTRSDQAIQHKLNAIADGLADLMTHTHNCSEGSQLGIDVAELKAAVGLESHESTSRNQSR